MEILNVGICEDDKIEQKVLLKLLEKSDYNIKIELFEQKYYLKMEMIWFLLIILVNMT